MIAAMFLPSSLAPHDTSCITLPFPTAGTAIIVSSLATIRYNMYVVRFSTIMLEAIGKNIGKGESVSLGWEGKDKMVFLVRDKLVGTVVDAALPKAIFDLYLGSSPVSPAAKAAFAEGVPAFLAS